MAEPSPLQGVAGTRQLVVVRLGAGVFAEQVSDRAPPHWPGLSRLADELADAADQRSFIVVHEPIGGSTAHRPWHDSNPTVAAQAVSAFGRRHAASDHAVVQALCDAGLPAHPCTSLQLAVWHGHELHLRGVSVLHEMVVRGLTPVVACAFVANLDRGQFSEAPGDALATRIARALGAHVLAHVAGEDHELWPAREARPSPARHVVREASVPYLAARRSEPHRRQFEAAYEAAGAGIRTLSVDGRLRGNLSAALRGDGFEGTELIAPSNVWPR